MKAKVFIKAEQSGVAKVIEFENGKKVEIPINKDGSVKWFDDSKLIKKEEVAK